MPGCGEQVPKGLPEGTIDPSTIPYCGPFDDKPTPDTNKPFVRDMRIDELEELVEKCVRRVLQGEDIKREFERLKAETKR